LEKRKKGEGLEDIKTGSKREGASPAGKRTKTSPVISCPQGGKEKKPQRRKPKTQQPLEKEKRRVGRAQGGEKRGVQDDLIRYEKKKKRWGENQKKVGSMPQKKGESVKSQGEGKNRGTQE